MSYRDRRKYRIDELPRDLHEALEMLEKDDVIKSAFVRRGILSLDSATMPVQH